MKRTLETRHDEPYRLRAKRDLSRRAGAARRRQARLYQDGQLRRSTEAISGGSAACPGTLLYALHAADGTPILLTDSREAAIANAWRQELETVSLH